MMQPNENNFEEYRVSLPRFPRDRIHNGARYGMFNRPCASSDPFAEGNLVPRIVANGHIVAAWYSCLMPTYYYAMPPNSGLLFFTALPSYQLSPSLVNPGDIDIIAIPYEGRELVLSNTLAIEVKVLRATYANQKKSPSRFGFSQALNLASFGMPYVAVAHLIVSDKSPRTDFKKYMAGIVDKNGRLDNLRPCYDDPLPSRLMDRSFGRLEANSPDQRIGFFVEFMHPKRVYFPIGKECSRFHHSLECMKSIEKFYSDNIDAFFRMPRYPEEIRF